MTEAEIKQRNDINKKNVEIKQKDKALERKEAELQQLKLKCQQKDKEIERLNNLLLNFLPDAHMCKVDFPNPVFTNKEAVMIVTLKNSNGNFVSSVGYCLSIFVKNQNGVQEKKIPSSNITEIQGHYNVSFILERTGHYSFSVRVHNEDIRGSPYE